MRRYVRNRSLLRTARRDDAYVPRQTEDKRFGMGRCDCARPARMMAVNALRRSAGRTWHGVDQQGGFAMECLLVHAGRSGRYCRYRGGRGNCRTCEHKNKHESGAQATRPCPQGAE